MIFLGEERVVDKKNKKGTVIQVNNKWGWFKVQFDNGFTRIYEGTGKHHDISIKLDPDYVRNK